MCACDAAWRRVSKSLLSAAGKAVVFRGGKGEGVNVLATVTGCAHQAAWCRVSRSLLSAVGKVVVF